LNVRNQVVQKHANASSSRNVNLLLEKYIFKYCLASKLPGLQILFGLPGD
jgi:hypothetical protein